LNDTGKSQARELQKTIEKLNIDLIITSPVLRARQTAEILNIHNIPIIESSNFSERNMGVYE
jgi:broad specificity phosphatase PhoE